MHLKYSVTHHMRVDEARQLGTTMKDYCREYRLPYRPFLIEHKLWRSTHE